MKKLLVIIIFLTIGSNLMSTPEIEKKLFTDLAAAYNKSTTAVNKAIAKSYSDASAAIVIPPTVVVPPVVPPVVTPPTNTAWPKDVTANPTGSKKPMTSVVGDLITQRDGEPIDAKNVTGKIIVKHNNVKITNFVTTGVWKDPGKTGLVMEDGKIDGQNIVEDAVRWSDYTARRVEITRTIDGFKGHGNVLIEDCWIHDLAFFTGAGSGAGGFSHNDGLQVSSGSNVVIRRTRIENTRGNSAVFVDADQGTISGVTIADNYFNNSGNYMVYVKQSASAPQFGLPSNITITGNVFGKRPDYLDPTWGLMAAEVHANNLVWTNNIQESSGKQLVLDSWGKANPA